MSDSPSSYLQPIDYSTSEFGQLYDELPLWSAPFGLMLLEHVPMKPAQSVVDIGAGTGFLAIELAERCGVASHVYAVDPWQGAMQRLELKIRQRDLHNVSCLVQDAATLDLPDNSIDVVVSNLGINNFDNASLVMQTCYRICKPGASLILTSNLVGHMQEFYHVLETVLRSAGLSRALANLQEHINHRATVASVTKLIGDAGFDSIQCTERPFYMRFSNGSALLRHFFIRLGFLPAWKQVISDAVQHDEAIIHEVFIQLEKALNQQSEIYGELKLTIPTACFVAKR